jgi:glycosyltransferase involved in cell wall biosynthesis
MKNFISRKWEIIKEENNKTGKSVYFIFLRKIFATTFQTPFQVLDLIITILALPVLMIMVILFRFKQKTKNIFFIGLEHLINKTAERGLGYKEKGYTSVFFSYEWSGMKHSLPFKARIYKYTFSHTIDTIVYAYTLIKYSPCYIETYFEGNSYRQLLAVLLSKIYGCVVVSIERGVWHGFKEHRVSFFLGWRYILIFKLSDKIFYRELGLFEIYDKYKLPREKFHFDYNKVKVYEEPNYERGNKNPEVLYLNGFKSFRRLDLLLKAIPLVKAKIPEVKFKIIGARSEEDISYVKKELSKLQIEETAHVDYWDPKPFKYYETASVFVLPAELVFCNFSLIEAMERGLPVVVTKVEDADRIVDDKVNGILCAMDEQSIAESIIQLLSNETERIEFGKNARIKIIKDFNSDKRLDPIVEIINKKIFHNV